MLQPPLISSHSPVRYVPSLSSSMPRPLTSPTVNLNPPPLGTIYAMAVNYPDPSIPVFDWNAPVATPSVSRMGIVTVFRGVPQQPNAWEYAELDEERSGEGLTVHDAVLLIEHCMDELVGPSPLFEMYLYFW